MKLIIAILAMFNVWSINVSIGAKKRSKGLIKDKIKNAKSTTWVTDGIPKWQVKLIVFMARLKAKLK